LLNATPPGAAAATFAGRGAFPNGTRNAYVAVTDLNGDGKPDIVFDNDSYSFSVLVNSPETATGTILENNSRVGVSLASGTQTVAESTGHFSVQVNLSSASTTDITIPFTLGGTAAAGNDYTRVTA